MNWTNSNFKLLNKIKNNLKIQKFLLNKRKIKEKMTIKHLKINKF